MRAEPTAREAKVVATDEMKDDKQRQLVGEFLGAIDQVNARQKMAVNSEEKLRKHWRAMGVPLEDANALLALVAKGYWISVTKADISGSQ
jgi:hypothetical protein